MESFCSKLAMGFLVVLITKEIDIRPFSVDPISLLGCGAPQIKTCFLSVSLTWENYGLCQKN